MRCKARKTSQIEQPPYVPCARTREARRRTSSKGEKGTPGHLSIHAAGFLHEVGLLCASWCLWLRKTSSHCRAVVRLVPR
jgi:hypothetical protein